MNTNASEPVTHAVAADVAAIAADGDYVTTHSDQDHLQDAYSATLHLACQLKAQIVERETAPAASIALVRQVVELKERSWKADVLISGLRQALAGIPPIADIEAESWIIALRHTLDGYDKAIAGNGPVSEPLTASDLQMRSAQAVCECLRSAGMTQLSGPPALNPLYQAWLQFDRSASSTTAEPEPPAPRVFPDLADLYCGTIDGDFFFYVPANTPLEEARAWTARAIAEEIKSGQLRFDFALRQGLAQIADTASPVFDASGEPFTTAEIAKAIGLA